MEKRILTIESEEDLKILTAISEPIESVEDEQELIASLKSYLNESSTSLGLAAPQIGVNKMAFAMKSIRGNKEITVCINPEITKFYPNKTGYFNESCLSIPDIKSITKRYKMIKVAYLNEHGVREKRLLKDIEAIVFQHEMDHLYGVLMTDKNIIKNESEEI